MNDKIISLENLQAILFDFDGVLAECMNVKTEAFTELYQPYGKDVVAKVVDHHITNGGISRYVKFRYYHENFLNQKITDEEVNDLAQQFSDLVVKKVIKSPWVSGSKDLLDRNYEKIDMYVISGTPQIELRKIVKERNMDHYFKGVYGSPDTKPVISHRIISKYNYNSKKVVYIGDSYSDYENAIEVNIPFIGRLLPGKSSPFPKDIPLISDFTELM